MNVAGRTAIVTGGGGGIGAALAERLVQDGARVLLADLDGERAVAVAQRIDAAHPGAALGVGADVASDDALAGMVARAEEAFGPVDLFFANAGIGVGLGLDSTEDEWARSIDVNVMAHVRAARLLVPGWLERGEGYFVSTASAAGLLTQIGSAPYSVTKHAAVAFSEWLSVTYGDRGIRVSCLCPMGVNTNMLNAGVEADEGAGQLGARAVLEAGAVLEPSEVAAAVLAAVDEERFLVLPHPEVLEFFARKGRDYDRWLRGMRRLQATVS
jgi:NAD(P)-dependent dehydrogenase (short-subunit alcohol dehydrogenase family)